MSLQITKIKGIPIRLHFTLIVVFFLIAWTLSASLMPEIHPSLTRTEYWIIGVFGASTSFISILLHELAHSIVALKYGLKVRQIVLFIFGGVSDIEEGDSSKDFHKEFKIAMVGPITSFVIAAILGLSWWILTSVAQGAASSPAIADTNNNATIVIAEAILQYGAIINTMLGGFNLVPAFPLDGGRILRSALLRWKRDYDQSTKIAVRIGTAISYVFMAIGFITMFSGSFIGGMWLLFIGWFLNSGAQSYLEQHQISIALSGVYLKDIMNTRFVSVKPDITVNELLNNYFNVYRKSEFPVVLAGRGEDPTGNELLGAITAKQASKVPELSSAGMISSSSANNTTSQKNLPTATFSAVFNMVMLNGSALHKHRISNFTLTSMSIPNEKASVSNGTATISMKEGPVNDVHVSIRTFDDNVISIWVDPAKTMNHFGNTPIYGTVTQAVLIRK
jgi:Zn-dependent protease